MTHQALTFAMARLGLDMPTCDCPCCGDTYDRDDMMGDRFNDEMTVALIARYGRSVCFGCADEHELCIGCGKAVKDDEREYTQIGTVCADCAADVEREAALDLEHERQERHDWREAR